MTFDFSGMERGIFVLVFLATLVSDILWALYIRRASSGHAFSAATFSLLIVLLGGFAVTEYVDNAAYLIPAALGAFIGTIITVRWDVKDSKDHPHQAGN
jgi:hypothetical protein